jgi:hypothetical protein
MHCKNLTLNINLIDKTCKHVKRRLVMLKVDPISVKGSQDEYKPSKVLPKLVLKILSTLCMT